MTDKRRVLIVDDDHSTVVTMRTLLQRAGLRVFQAATCAEALTCCDGQPVDVLIADRRLPDGDGMLLLEKMLQDNPQLRGIICSGVDGDATDDRWRIAGYTAYVHKPIDFDRLLNLVVGHEPGPFHATPA